MKWPRCLSAAFALPIMQRHCRNKLNMWNCRQSFRSCLTQRALFSVALEPSKAREGQPFTAVACREVEEVAPERYLDTRLTTIVFRCMCDIWVRAMKHQWTNRYWTGLTRSRCCLNVVTCFSTKSQWRVCTFSRETPEWEKQEQELAPTENRATLPELQSRTGIH